MTYEASMVVSPRIKSFMRIRSARVVFPLTVGDDEFGEQSAPETVIWTEEIPSQTCPIQINVNMGSIFQLSSIKKLL